MQAQSLAVYIFIFFQFISFACSAQVQSRERFVGLHFDFHAKATDAGIGKSLTEQSIDSFLRITKPDFIQVDCKGHPGYSSYPTKAGNAAPGIVKDILQMYRNATAANNVGLYAHYSGLIDGFAISQHPEWAITNADGARDNNLASPAGKYADELLIPQLKELATAYKLDGVWVDGNCWAVRPDYSNTFTNAFKQKDNIAAIPKSASDTGYAEWIEFNRAAYKTYLNHFINEVHKANPHFLICDNWAFGSKMPQKIDAGVDFLSADIRGETPYEAAFESRCFAGQGKPWDIMSWALIDNKTKTGYKSLSQLCQEAANVLAIGGGFETYWPQNRDGSLPKKNITTMAALIDFCRQRKDYCFNGQVIPQIGIFYSYDSWKAAAGSDHLYVAYGASFITKVMSTLIDKQYSVSILNDFNAAGKLSQYPLIVIPQWQNISSNTIQQLKEYVKNGGSLLVLGTVASRQFADIGGVKLVDNTIIQTLVDLPDNDSGNVSAASDFQKTQAMQGAETIMPDKGKGNLSKYPLATIAQYGKGKAGLVYLNVSKLYNQPQSAGAIQNLIASVAAKLHTSPMVTIKNAPQLQQVVAKKDNHLFIHLINMGGKEAAYDNAPPLQAFKVEVTLNKKPSTVILQPEHKSLPFEYNNGKLTIELPGLNIYSILQID